MNMIEQFSSDLADRVAAAASVAVAVRTGRQPTSGILWRSDVVVVSEQMLPKHTTALQVLQGGQTVNATLAGRDAGTNVAVLKLETPLGGTLPPIDNALRGRSTDAAGWRRCRWRTNRADGDGAYALG